jgi:hypothetical protein
MHQLLHQARCGSRLEYLHQARADHHCIGNGGHRFGACRIADAEAYTHRQLDMGFDSRQGLRHRRRIEMTGTCHALERHVVHIAAGQARDILDALLGRGGCQHENQIQAGLGQRSGQAHAFFGRIVDHQYTVDTGLARSANEGARTQALVVAFDRIGITHQHHGRAGIAAAELAHSTQHLRHTDTACQCSLRSFLNHRPVGHRVRERHAQLDDVGTALGQRDHDVGRGIGKGIARSDVGDEGLAALRLQSAQRAGDTAHRLGPIGCAPPLTERPWHEGRQ